MMNPDFALILNFQLRPGVKINPDFLVKTARNIGARAVSDDLRLKDACRKYTIALFSNQKGQNLTSQTVISTMVHNRQAGKRTIINVPVNKQGQFEAETRATLSTINQWMHMFGHAFNDGQPSKLASRPDGFVLFNRHAPYQKYVFLKTPLPQQITVTGLDKEPALVEWLINRQSLKFNFVESKLTINLAPPAKQFNWQVLRIQAHRPEDDLAPTKF